MNSGGGQIKKMQDVLPKRVVYIFKIILLQLQHPYRIGFIGERIFAIGGQVSGIIILVLKVQRM
jgi:hypothetical protein